MFVLSFSSGPLHADEIRVGAAKVEFQLPANVPLAGYSRRGGKPSEGAREALGVRALVLRDGGTAAALVSAELLIIDEALMREVRAELSARGWPADAEVLLAATHTHSGPGAYGRRYLEKLSMGHFNPAVFSGIVSAVVDAVLAADAAAGPALMASGAVETPEFIVNRMEDGGGTDPELITVGWYREGSADPFAVVLTYSAHPTVLGPQNMRRAGDYPGGAMRSIERLSPGAVALFFAGAVADQGPAKGGEAFLRSDEIGRGLAARALTALKLQHPARLVRLQAGEERLRLPPARVRVGKWRLPRWLGKRLVDDDATLPLVSAGPVLFIGAPCDLASPLGLQLKQRARELGRQPVVIGFANDYIGYCIPSAWYASDEYEAGMAFNGPDAGELITERLLQMIEELTDSSRHAP